jgi:predicted nucleic acid-binding protein
VSTVVYLDICCFKRPFDDASMERVRREAEAVAAIMRAAESGGLQLVHSPAHDLENARNPREDRRFATSIWLETAVVKTSMNPEIARRSRTLNALGFTPLDSLHLAFAESAATCFITTDDRLIRRARSHGKRVGIPVLRPDEFAIPVEEDGE